MTDSFIITYKGVCKATAGFARVCHRKETQENLSTTALWTLNKVTATLFQITDLPNKAILSTFLLVFNAKTTT